MMYDIFQLLEFLNYDSNTKGFLTQIERCLIHKAIARLRNQREPREFPQSLKAKLHFTEIDMKKSNWKSVIIRIGQDRIPYMVLESEL